MTQQQVETVNQEQYSRRDMLKLSCFGVLCAAAAGVSAGCTRFSDAPGANKNQFGRTVNAISAVVTGLVAQAVSPGSTIEAKIEKFAWPSADMSGKTTGDSIDVAVQLSLTSCKFTAKGEPGAVCGNVDKSEFDWEVKQQGPGEWKIGRSLLKFDYTLKLTAEDGKIKGKLVRPGGFDWSINGTYDSSSFQYTVQPGLGDPSFSVKGKFAER